VLILAASVVVTLAVGSLVLMICPDDTRNIINRHSPPSSTTALDPKVTRADDRRILRLTRNAERLDTVEQDLIRAMANGEPLSEYTRKLLTEMRIRTCKLLGDLSDIDRSRAEAGREVDKRPPEPARR